MADLVREGKVRYLGPVGGRRRNPAPGRTPSIRSRALQSEYSLWERGVEAKVAAGRARELGIGFVPLLAARPRLPDRQSRRAPKTCRTATTAANDPRYQGANTMRTWPPSPWTKRAAAAHGGTAAQVALAWLLAKGKNVVPIPGWKRRVTLEDNAGADALPLNASDIAALDAALPPGTTAGDRYGSKAMMAMVRL